MTVRTPLKLDGSNLKEMSSAEITANVNRAAVSGLYACCMGWCFIVEQSPVNPRVNPHGL